MYLTFQPCGVFSNFHPGGIVFVSDSRSPCFTMADFEFAARYSARLHVGIAEAARSRDPVKSSPSNRRKRSTALFTVPVRLVVSQLENGNFSLVASANDTSISREVSPPQALALKSWAKGRPGGGRSKVASTPIKESQWLVTSLVSPTRF